MITRFWPAIFLLLAIWVLFPEHAQAQEPRVKVSSTAPYPMIIDGKEVTQFPFFTSPGTQVCLVEPLGYLNEQERLAFQRWSHGPTDVCVILDEPGDYTAQYQHEVLLQIRSTVKDYRASTWVPRGAPALLTVPETVEERQGVRYLFEEWTGGESPFSADNRIVPNRPLTLEVRWTKQYFLELVGPGDVRLSGGGWHREGQNVVLKAPPTAFSPNEEERLQFAGWEVLSDPIIVIPNRQAPITSIRVNDTHQIRAVYEIAYQVVVENPAGTLIKDWYSKGKQLTIDTPPTIEVTAGLERQNFSRWEGLDLATAKGVLEVTGPINAKAIYDREYKVAVESPFGASGQDWYQEGEIATIEVPENPSTVLFIKRVFREFSGHPGSGPLLRVPVTGPTTITASYSTVVDVSSLLLVLGALLLIGVIYLITQREYNRRKRGSRW